MLSNYLKIALRNLRRHPVFTSINLFGLAVGMAACFLIFLFIRDEMSYDRHHERGDRIFRIINESTSEGTVRFRASTPPGLAAALKEDFPEVEEAVRIYYMGRTLVQRAEAKFFESGVLLADSSIFDVFTLPLVVGDPNSALSAPYSLIVSESLARKYFPDGDALGQVLILSGGSEFTITGIVPDQPDHAHLNFSMIGSFATMYDFESAERLSNWIWQQFYTYVLLEENASPVEFRSKIPDFIARRATPETESWGFTYDFRLQPLTDIYLKSSNLEFDYGPRGNASYVWIFGAIAVFILLIACFNFMNLSTARAMQRAREVGLRKVVGADRGRLVRQFLGESMLMAVLGFAGAVLLVWIGLPALNQLSGKTLSFGGATLLSLAGPVVFVLLAVGLLAGAYPALYLARFRPVAVLKGTAASGRGGAMVRKSLVVVQFVIGVALMAGTGIVARQLGFIRSQDLGFQKDLLVKLPARSGVRDNLSAVMDDLDGHAAIVNATASWGSPGTFAAGDDVRFPGREERWTTNMYLVDYEFIPTYQMEMVSGRAFERERSTDAAEAFILNESAVRALGWTAESALGQEILWDRWDADAVKAGRVIGVVRDFNYKSLHLQVEPLVLHISTASIGQVSVRIAPGNVTEALDYLKTVWGTYAPEWPFEYDFLDAELAENYIAEERLAETAGIFSGLALLIACLGLFGLTSYVVERRTREIGVRKVLGATTANVVTLLSKDFIVLIGLAIVIAIPIAHFGMQGWIQNFAYQTGSSVVMYLSIAIFSLVLGFVTIGTQALRAAIKDPAKTLRYE